jgi:general secretion pathway protein A
VFKTVAFDTAIERLTYLADRQGIGLLVGTPGTGKTTALRAFLHALPRAGSAICYVCHTSCASLDLYRDIARGFQIEPRFRKADVFRELKDRLLRLSREKKLRPILVIDEAHLLPSCFLDEVRLLSNFEHDGEDHLTLILAGHPQLESNLALAVNEALAQRIVVRIRFRSLSVTEVGDYLAFRLERAGRTAKLFLDDAVAALAKASRGVPRLVDRLAEHSLLLAFAAKVKEIDVEIVTEAMAEADL